ncbi:MAG: hypothetical protein NC344_01765 [Bacteroidales bacterium]|nr:hypothetical protein [Bacteroidales bacterium]MCM1146561.1 hypothetical protein [Bacteroidales bacterium]MCM1205953.1 hypothetical protein [Bacillota bacterium]MCM1510167.1 hypothetical protein [Clostridium sp.]
MKKKLLMLVLLPIILFLGAWGCGDITQYKRIGNTSFYLVETMAISSEGHPLPNLYYSQNPYKDGFSGINQKGIPYRIFWNERFIVIKCSDINSKKIINYCIIKDLKTTNKNPDDNYNLHEYNRKDEYEEAMRFFGLNESEMFQTDNNIPWSLHLW